MPDLPVNAGSCNWMRDSIDVAMVVSVGRAAHNLLDTIACAYIQTVSIIVVCDGRVYKDLLSYLRIHSDSKYYCCMRWYERKARETKDKQMDD